MNGSSLLSLSRAIADFNCVSLRTNAGIEIVQSERLLCAITPRPSALLLRWKQSLTYRGAI
jgi:hypothetical protein